MLSNIILNLLAGLVTLSLSGSVALHDSRIDKVFLSAASTGTEAASHDYGHALSHELHVHNAREAVSGDPSQANRSHRRHTALPHSRFKLSLLSA